MTIQMREATGKDLGALHALASRCLPFDRFSPQLLAEKLLPSPGRPGWRTRTHVAVDGSTTIGFMQSIIRDEPAKCWVGMFAVAPERRRSGIAKRLFDGVSAGWPAGAESEVLAVPGNYFHPGLDPRYTEALCFVESLGYSRFKDCANLIAPLDCEFDVAGEIARLAREGITIRRAASSDAALLGEFFQHDFGEDWKYEAGLGLANSPPSLHLAIERGAIIGFSAHSTQNREWGFFGPMGTTPAARGKGVGRAVLWLCLNDLRAAGHRAAVIPWVGPISFYHRWAGARVERVFWRYRREG